MSRVDYTKLDAKLEELEALKVKFEEEVAEATKDTKSVVTLHETNLQHLYDYQRNIIDYIDIRLKMAAQQTTEVDEDCPPELAEELTKCNTERVQLIEQFYPVFNEYLTKLGNECITKITELKAEIAEQGGTSATQQKKLHESEWYARAINISRVLPHIQAKEDLIEIQHNKSYERCRAAALENIQVIREAIQLKVWAANEAYLNEKGTVSDNLDNCKNAIKQLKRLQTLHKQIKVLELLP